MDDSQIVLFSNFDSGNLARYERVFKPVNPPVSSSQPSQTAQQNTSTNNQNLVDKQTEPELIQQKFDIEFNVWTRADCDGTPVGPNPNRTWFYFGVRGGHGKFIKFNMMNLNRQARLFDMGMLPVFKTVPGHEKWSRTYIKPTWQTIDNQFYMSFIHRFPDRKDSITYFAFCFPHSYDECQSMLKDLDKKFEYCKYLTHEKTDPDTIYYHRELLCYSLDKRRIDLITISACNDSSFKQEPRFDPDNLFPKNEDEPNKRCLSFDQKKVYILTSRVHPGETPASFVFNGFLDFILRKDDPRARILRRNFVFKLIPMLNPDGVARGHYRTDQLGVNLNRVYKEPDFDKHPSIYAVKSLIVFHHVNNRTSKEHDNLNFDNLFKLEHESPKTSSLASTSMVSIKSDFILPTKFRSRSFTLLNDSPRVMKMTKSLEIGNENSDEDDNGIDYLKPNPKAAHLNDPRLSLINPIWSGVAFYVDLHGHAAKRGCFIYGNAIENEMYQIENVLFAKLVAFNTQHFDFEGCNFSVKNMFMKDKREGLSKDGSGRVAMFKILGIIHSYTLECSYASGRTMNTIPPAINWNPRNGMVSPPLHTDLPPKFTIEHYADVGKALAIAALDISEANPFTRINNSSFGSLEAVRNWIKFYIRSKNFGGIQAQNSQNNLNQKKSFTRPQKNVKPVKLVQIQNKIPRLTKLSNTEKSHRLSLPGELGQTDEKQQKMKKNFSLTNSGYKSSNFDILNPENIESRLGQRKLLPINKAKIGANSIVLFNKINSNSSVKSKNTMNDFKKDVGVARVVKSAVAGLDSDECDDDYVRPSFYLQEKNDLIDKLEKIDFVVDSNLEGTTTSALSDQIDTNLIEAKRDLDSIEQVKNNCNIIESNGTKIQKSPINLILNDFNKKLIRLKRK